MKPMAYLPSWKGIWQYLRDPRSSWPPKALLVVAILYLLFPFDLVPDLAPIVGWLDDLGLNILAIWYVLRAAKTYEHTVNTAKRESLDEPHVGNRQ